MLHETTRISTGDELVRKPIPATCADCDEPCDETVSRSGEWSSWLDSADRICCSCRQANYCGRCRDRALAP